MRKFSEFVNDMNQMPMGNQPQVTPQMQQPQMQQPQMQMQQNTAAFEDLRNDLQRMVTKLQKLLDSRQVTKDQAKDVLTTLVQTVMDRSNISDSAALKAVRGGIQNSGIRTNTEPMGSPPMQPMAQ